MSHESASDFFAAPPFDSEQAFLLLKRQLRGLTTWTERGPGFELQGKRVIELTLEGAVLRVRLAKRPAISPEWETIYLKSNAEVRKFVDEVKTRLGRWGEE